MSQENQDRAIGASLAEIRARTRDADQLGQLEQRVAARARQVMLADVIETLEDGWDGAEDPVKLLRRRFPHLLEEE